MQPSSDPAATVAGGAPALGVGISRYVELFRQQPAAADLEAMRLTGDLTARRFASGWAPEVERFDSSVAAPGREIPLRIFDPGGRGRRAAICYFHGGGFAMGSVESFDIVCAALAEATGAVVVSVHYRRLPEADYRTAQDDCDEAFAWLIRQAAVLGIDPARTGAAGDSAGALFAFACSANLRTAPTMPAFQLLFYGTFSMDPERPAYAGGRDPLLTAERVRQYIALFRASGGLVRNPAPIERTDLPGLPPTHFVAAEHDPLRSETEELAARLHAAGVPTTVHVAPGMIHGFLRAVSVSPDARRELERAADAACAMVKDVSK